MMKLIRIYFTDGEIWDRVVTPKNYAKRVNAIARNIKRKKKYDKCTVEKIQFLGGVYPRPHIKKHGRW